MIKLLAEGEVQDAPQGAEWHGFIVTHRDYPGIALLGTHLHGTPVISSVRHDGMLRRAPWHPHENKQTRMARRSRYDLRTRRAEMVTADEG